MSARKKAAQTAARSHSDLNIFAAIVAILEGGCIYRSNATAQKIIGICQREQQKLLRDYDQAVADILAENPHG